ncbi:MAG: 16S rRNA (guanine(966)-N(2))-methyltransferase RsmD [Desulfosarcina sp.]|nr:16S rRNA (guanine(966)-N(2))-methyltransferase RsmD [Desulfobacterales bacterium]
MRIIAGTYRGRRIRAPRGRWIRPTSDRLRETIFNIIGPDIRGQKVLDIYAGTGAMGIEALSRGADHSVFIDKHPLALECMQANLEPLGNSNQWDIIRWDAEHNLRCLAARALQFGYAFVDPPYNQGLVALTLRHLIESGAMKSGGLIVLEHHQQERIDPAANSLTLWDQRRYGKTLVTFLRIMI